MNRCLLIALVLLCLFFAQPTFSQDPADDAPITPEVLWTVETKSDSKGSAAVADIDGDGKLEIVFGTYFNDRRIYAVSAVDGRVKWRFLSDRGPLDASVAIADLDNDGKPEVLAADSSSGNVFCLNGQGEEKWRLKLPNSTDSPPAIADIDGDGKLDIIFCEGARLQVLDSQGKPLFIFEAARNKNRGARGRISSAPVVADFDGDGALDVFFVVGRGYYGRGGKLKMENWGRGYALRLGGKGKGWTTFRGNLHRTGR